MCHLYDIKGLFQSHQDTRGTICKGTICDVGVAGDPADVSCAPVHVVIVMIENVLEGQRRVEQITSNSVKNTLYHTQGQKHE